MKRIEKGRYCVKCLTTSSYKNRSVKKPYTQWYVSRQCEGFLCYKCYQRYIQYPRYYKKKYNHIRNQQAEYYQRVTRPKLEKRKEELLSC